MTREKEVEERMRRLRQMNLVWLTLILLLVIFALSCKTTGARKHWWEFWKPKKPATASIYPEEQVLPPPPAKEAEPTGKVEPLEAAKPKPGELAVPTPLRQEPRGVISELQTVHFEFDSAELLPEAKTILDQNAQWLLAHPDIEIMIEGHCDERGTIEYNLNLGQRRADAVREYVVSKGVNAEKLHTISYGKERPIDAGHSEEAWAKNRRAQFLIY
jgi:peptidoglycan-associated lipoprotein